MQDLKREYFVRKRDGRIVPFDPERIRNAIFRATKAVGGDLKTAEKVVKAVVSRLESSYLKRGDIPHIETIQDIIESELMKHGMYETAKAYVLYREKRRETREISAINIVQLVDDYIQEKDWRVKENSNMNFSLQGLNFHISSRLISNYWLTKIYPKEISEAHKDGNFHIHDLGVLGAYCCGWDLYDLIVRGFGGVSGKIESKPPKHFRSALGQIVNFFYTLQGEAAGAQAFSNFDTLLAPFIAYDRLSYSEVKQCLQEFLFNINVPTRTGFQTPFTNLTLDLVPSLVFKDNAVVIGGKLMDSTYGEFQKEMDMLNQAFCELMIEGDAKGRIFTFPIPTYNITKDFPWEKPELEVLWKMTSKYGIPYFANFVNSDMKPEDVRSMCCRLRLDTSQLQNKGGGLFGANPLTGSLGVVTLNMPRLGYLSEDEEEFFERLEQLLQIAKASLEIKRKVVEDLTDRGLYPYCKVYLKGVKERTSSWWGNHFSTIGVVGMNEMCLNFLGVPITHPEGKSFSVKVLEYIREKIVEFQKETGHLFNLEATPAEGTSYRLARIDKRKFPDIKTSGTDTRPYYTNSVHPPVGWTNDIWEILKHQDDLQVLFTGGTVVHLYIGEEIRYWRATRNLVKYIMQNFRVPYISITPTFSVCPVHGYIPGRHDYCPYPHTKEELEKYGVDI